MPRPPKRKAVQKVSRDIGETNLLEHAWDELRTINSKPEIQRNVRLINNNNVDK